MAGLWAGGYGAGGTKAPMAFGGQPGFGSPSGAPTTERQNQWLMPGNMPIDEGAVAYQRTLELLSGVGGGGGAGGGGGVPPRETGDDSAWGAMLAGQMGAAKDNAAAAVGAARRALINNMTQRGIGGSGIEGKNERAIQIAGAGQLGAAGRDIATQTAARTASVNDRNYSGDITQRGQDIQASTARMSMLPSLLGLFRSASY